MPRLLSDIEIEEISIVDSGANKKKRFHVIKRRSVMHEELKELFEQIFEPDEIEEMEEEIKVLKGDDLEKAEKISDNALKAIKGALNILNKYKDDMPDDVLSAIKTLTKYASYGYPQKRDEDKDIEKAGAKLSKFTRDQIQKALAIIKESPKAIAILKVLLGEEVQKIEDKKIDEDDLLPEIQAKLKKLAEYQEKEKKEIEKAEKEKEEKEKKEKEELEERLTALEKEKGIKKSIDDSGDGDADDKDVKKKDEEEDLYPSIPIPVIDK